MRATRLRLRANRTELNARVEGSSKVFPDMHGKRLFSRRSVSLLPDAGATDRGLEKAYAGTGFPSSLCVYSASRKFFPNGDTLLDKPAVPPGRQSVIFFENRFVPNPEVKPRKGT